MNASRVRFFEAMYHDGQKVPELRDFYNYFISGGKVIGKKKAKPTKRKIEEVQKEEEEEVMKRQTSTFLPSLDPTHTETPLSSLSSVSGEEGGMSSSASTSPSPKKKESEEEEEREEEEEEEEEGSKSPTPPKSSSPSKEEGSKSKEEGEESHDSIQQEKEEKACESDNIRKGTLQSFQDKIDMCLDEKAQPPKTPKSPTPQEEDKGMERIKKKIKILEKRLR